MQYLKKYLLYLMVLFYFGAGLMHFLFYSKFLFLMPKWLPMPVPLILLSGTVEMTLAVLLLFTSTRKFAAWMIIMMLVIYFFVNHLTQSINFYDTKNQFFVLTVFRLIFQFVLIWWAWVYTREKNLKI